MKKKGYETPKIEKIDFDYEETITASGNNSGLTDAATTAWWKCETRYTDVKNIEGTVCGYV